MQKNTDTCLTNNLSLIYAFFFNFLKALRASIPEKTHIVKEIEPYNFKLKIHGENRALKSLDTQRLSQPIIHFHTILKLIMYYTQIFFMNEKANRIEK